MPQYQSSEARAADNRSSAYTLLAVGGVGFLAVALIFFDVIPIYRNAGVTKYLVCGVMGAMFVLFIVFGFVSMRDSKLLSVKAKSENTLRSELNRWCRENLDGGVIDTEILEEGEMLTDLQEEEKYYRRTERMRAVINEKFMNLDEAFVEDFVDGYYQEMYENNGNYSR